MLIFVAAVIGHHLRREKKDGTYSKGAIAFPRQICLLV